jgi:hypothetical protein
VEPSEDALDQLDSLARAVKLAETLIRDPAERRPVVGALVARAVERWPEDAPLAGAGTR